MSERIYVTRAFLPPKEEYCSQLNTIWENHHLTNSGPLHQNLELKISEYLKQPLVLVNNGTAALQLAIKALNISGEIITTPYSYVATLNAILWEKCTPVFVDIDDKNFSIDNSKIEEKITPHTRALLITHVYGLPGDLEKIELIASKYRLPVIYDAAHAFGVKYKGKSILSYGNLSTLSFHATKLFHTVEGGAIAVHDPELKEKLYLLRSFGHRVEEYFGEGINAKMSEVHAAMGLINLNYIEKIVEERRKLTEYYDINLKGLSLIRPSIPSDTEYNYSYYPILFETNNIREHLVAKMEKENIFPRRYFYPSLNKLPQVNYSSCPVSENITERVLCLPLYNGLSEENMNRIISVLKSCLG